MSEVINKIFSSDSPLQNAGTTSIGSVIKKDRVDLLNQSVAQELNTYRNWAIFQLPIEPVITGKEGSNVKKEGVKAYGVKSLFNNVNAVPIMEPIRKANNVLLLDTPEGRRESRDRSVCTIKELVRASGAGEMGRAIYNYSDFMYCKHLGKIPNNYLITLRRFPFPCGDYITYTMPNSANEKETQGHLPDIGRLVTWIGTPGNDMSNILKYSYKMNWKPLDAKI